MTKKHILKPGRHQFAPGSYAIHHNDDLSDEEAEWYLQKYPHIASMFAVIPKDKDSEEEIKMDDKACRVSDEEVSPPLVQSEQQSVKSQNNEDLFTTN
jgi:hypothetical protein